MAIKVATLPVITVSSANTAVALHSTTLYATSITIQAEYTNVGNVAIGDSNVTALNGLELPPGDAAEITADNTKVGSEEFDVSQIFVNSSTSGNKVRIAVFKRVP